MKQWLRYKWRRFRYPTGVHTWRWRMLGVWLIVFTSIVAWSLHRQGDQARHATALADQNRRTNIRQERTIRTLCDDLYIVNGLTETAIETTRLRLIDHQKEGNQAQIVADQYAIRNYEQQSAAILDQLTNKDSPCVAP